MLADYLGTWEFPCILSKQGNEHSWDIWIASKEELINQTLLPGGVLMLSYAIYIVKVQTVEEMVIGSILGALQPLLWAML